MSDLAYHVVVTIGRHIFFLTSRPTILHRDRAKLKTPYILASSHLSPYDVALMLYTSPKKLDFLSITEMHKHWLAGPLFTAMNCVFADRKKNDVSAAQGLAKKLKAGRNIAMFPEGHLRSEETSVINGGHFKPGVIKLAQLAQTPIVPVVVLGANGFAKPTAWIPIMAIRWGINYGEPIYVENTEEGKAHAIEKLQAAYKSLADELKVAMHRG